jgi:aminopeptidase N
MYLILIAALLGSVSAIPHSEPRMTLAERYNLPRETIPLHYDVRLYLNPDNQAYFYGNVTIRIIPTNQTNQIVLHAMEMTIDNVRVYNERDQVDLYLGKELATDDTHLLKINVSQTLMPSVVYILHIDYVAQFARNMFGIYVSNYQEPNGTLV